MNAEPFKILQLTQHWTVEDDGYFRDVVVELADGSRRLYGIREDYLENLLDVAA